MALADEGVVRVGRRGLSAAIRALGSLAIRRPACRLIRGSPDASGHGLSRL
jgi:hypothetical protein